MRVKHMADKRQPGPADHCCVFPIAALTVSQTRRVCVVQGFVAKLGPTSNPHRKRLVIGPQLHAFTGPVAILAAIHRARRHGIGRRLLGPDRNRDE
jgi:hypothetical protein